MFESGLSHQPQFLKGIISVSVTLILEAIGLLNDFLEFFISFFIDFTPIFYL